MKLRKFTAGMVLELFLGMVLPLLFVVPFLAVMCWILVSTLTAVPLWIAAINVLWVAPLPALAFLWTLILFGTRPVVSRPWFRTVFILVGLAGLLPALFLFALLLLSGERGIANPQPLVITPDVLLRGKDWRLLLIGTVGPFFVGLRYLWVLLRGRR